MKSVILSDVRDKYQSKQFFDFPNEIYELETKPKRTFNFYPNVNAKQRDTVLKPSKAKETHSKSYPIVTEKQRGTLKKSSKPKETNDSFSPNVTENQRDTVLKPSNTKQIHNRTFDFPRITGNNHLQKTKSYQ